LELKLNTLQIYKGISQRLRWVLMHLYRTESLKWDHPLMQAANNFQEELKRYYGPLLADHIFYRTKPK
jgi:hypothetical protein